MKIKDILKGGECGNTGVSDTEICSIVNDSRKADLNSLFIAYSGYVEDAHRFIPDAYERGCRNFVVDKAKIKDINDGFGDAKFYAVSDLPFALSVIARNFYDNPSAKFSLIGITGTNGKTTTTTAIYNVLRAIGKKAGLIGTIEYRINDKIIQATNTTPDILDIYSLMADMVKSEVEYVVMEVSSHALALNRVLGLNFDIACFTNFTQDHLDFHGDMNSYLSAKLKLFSLLEKSVKPRKTALINMDIPQYETIRDYIKKLNDIKLKTYSIENPDADYYSRIVRLEPSLSEFEFKSEGIDEFIELSMIGHPNVYNFTLTGAVLSEAGFDISRAKRYFKEIKVRGRMEVLHCDGITAVVDYAHTPDALENAVSAVRAVMEPSARLICVFGAGGDRDKTKRPIMGEIATRLSDIAVVTSDNPRTEDPLMIIEDIKRGALKVRPGLENTVIEPDRAIAIRKAIETAKPDDVVIIAGKGHEDYQIIGKTKYRFSDKEEVMKIFGIRAGK
jgi:UDP-N-acetylmuramoyl-L-alanyl-D-glutamate--2,6-diaminopimelate ligase